MLTRALKIPTHASRGSIRGVSLALPIALLTTACADVPLSPADGSDPGVGPPEAVPPPEEDPPIGTPLPPDQMPLSLTYLYYGCNDSGHWNICAIRADGTNPGTKITTRIGEDIWPSVSPDGRRIAFQCLQGVCLVDSNGMNLTTISDPLLGAPSWSPDGDRLVVRRLDGSIATMDTDGGRVRQVTSSGISPDWSPDGRRIAFITLRDSPKWDIHVINVDGSGETALTRGPAFDVSPEWSPDGSRIAFASDRGGGAINIWLMDADGSNMVNLTNSAYSEGYPTWSPDGSRIAFRRSGWGIMMMDPDGSNEVTLAGVFPNYGLTWTP